MLQRLDAPARRPASAPRRRPGPWLALYAAALGLRVAYAWVAIGPHASPFSDPADYDAVAWNLARGHGFSLNGAGGPYPTAFLPPLLPWLASLLYGIVGHRYFAALLLQCALGALVPLLIAAFGRAMYGGSVGRLAGWIAAVHPLLVFFCGYLLTETLFVVTLLCALVLSAEWVKTPRRGRAFGAGIAWGLAALARPTALLLPAVVLPWAWGPLGLTVPAGERARQMGLLLLGLALTVGPWTLRNAAVMHAFVPVTTGGGGALFVGNNDEVWNDPERRGGATGGAWSARVASEFRGLSEPEVDRRARARASEFLARHVADWPAMAWAKLRRFWRLRTEGRGTGEWQRAGSPLGGLVRRLDPLLVWSLATLPFALWGAFLTLRGPRRWFQSLSLWVVFYFSLIAIVFFGSLRMRLPVEPLLGLLAAAGFEDARRSLRGRARGLRVIEGKRGSGA